MGEGAGVLVLESLEHALARSATIYAEIRGFGLSGDAFHVTAPSSDGSGAALCMLRALKSAHVDPECVDYVNAHATSTPVGDLAENRAIKTVFGRHAFTEKFCVSSCKGAIGHLLGAAGAVEAIFSILAIHEGLVPPSINIENLEAEFDLDYTANEARTRPIRTAVCNSFGFGGTNASLLFQRFDA